MPIFLPFFPKLLTPLFLPIIFSSMATTIHRRKAEIDRTSCLDEFDAGLRKQCMRGEWEEKYYFESGSQTCRLFWYDGCPFAQGSRNFFDSLMECQWLCEPSPKADVCFEPFDEHLRDECVNGELRRRFYFDRHKLRCVPFWSDGCESESGNQFDDEDVCMQRCELPRTTNQQTQRPLRPSNIYASRLITTTPFPDKLLRKPPPAAFGSTTSAAGVGSKGPTPTHQQQRQQHPISFLGSSEHKSKKTTPLSHAPVANPSIMMSLSSSIRTPYATSTMEPLEKGRAINLCDRANPCQNNGKCEWNAQTGQYICRCPPGFTNDNCTEPIDYDPCSAEPCQNGATCAAKASPEKGTEYDCFCSRGFAGRHCELKPCEENPCKNGGTCRTTRSLSLFFCACAVGWGGKTCMIAIPSSSEEAENAMQMDANFTQQLSSGRIEWIENMRLITSTLSTTTEKKNASGNFESTKDSSAGDDSLVLRRSKEYNYSHSTMPEQIIVEELPSIKLKSKEANGGLNTFAKKLDFKQIFLICFILHAFLPH